MRGFNPVSHVSRQPFGAVFYKIVLPKKYLATGIAACNRFYYIGKFSQSLVIQTA